MLGSELAPVLRQGSERGREVLRVRGCQLDARSACFDLSLHEGEVVAMTGLLGAGKSEIAEIFYGLRQPLTQRAVLRHVVWRDSDCVLLAADVAYVGNQTPNL